MTKQSVFRFSFLYALLLILLTSCKMSVEDLARMADEFNSECPVNLTGVGEIVGVTSEDSTLVYSIKLYPCKTTDVIADDDNTSLFRPDSMINRPADVKTMLGSVIFQPSGLLESNRNTMYDRLTHMGGKLRVDLIKKDSTSVMSVEYAAREIDELTMKLYKNASYMYDADPEYVLELNKAILKLEVPFSMAEDNTMIDVYYDDTCYCQVSQIALEANPSEFEANLHDNMVKWLRSKLSGINSFMNSFYVNDISALVSACATSNRSMRFVFENRRSGQQFETDVNAEELQQLLDEMENDEPVDMEPVG